MNLESYDIIIGDDPEVDDINEGMFAEIWFKGVQIAEIIEPHPYEVVIYLTDPLILKRVQRSAG